MDNTLILLLIVIAVPIIVVVIMLRFPPSRLDKDSPWKSMAESLGLELVHYDLTNGVVIAGTLEGHETTITTDILQPHAGPIGNTVEISVALLQPLTIGLEVNIEGVFTGFGKAADSPDIVVGDPQIDRLYQIRGLDEAAVIRLFTPKVKDVLKTLKEKDALVTMDDTSATVHYPERVGAPPLVLVEVLGLAIKLVLALEASPVGHVARASAGRPG